MTLGLLRGRIADSKRSADAWDALSLRAQRLLRDHRPLPRELEVWLADYLKGERPRPTKRGAKQKFHTRDALIRTWIATVIAFENPPGICATRNEAKGGEEPGFNGGSACDAIGVALNNIEIESSPRPKRLTYAAIEKVWTTRFLK